MHSAQRQFCSMDEATTDRTAVFRCPAIQSQFRLFEAGINRIIL